MPSEAFKSKVVMTSLWTVDDVNHLASTTPDDCITEEVNATISWHNPRNLVSTEADYRIERIKSAIIRPVLYLIGFQTSCLNRAVLSKQGLKETINTCLFTLALVDLIDLVTIFAFSVERI